MFKVSIGIAVAVVTCAIGVSASVASAATFHSESANTEYEFVDEGVQVIGTNAGEIECETFVAWGETLGNKAPELITAGGAGSGWGACELFGVAVNEFESECEGLFRAEHMLTLQSTPGGNCTTVPITFTAAGLCSVKIGPQTVTEIKYKNQGKGAEREIVAELAITNLAYTFNGALCGAGSAKNGTWTGEVVITGTDKESGKQTGVWWE